MMRVTKTGENSWTYKMEGFPWKNGYYKSRLNIKSYI